MLFEKIYKYSPMPYQASKINLITARPRYALFASYRFYSNICVPAANL